MKWNKEQKIAMVLPYLKYGKYPNDATPALKRKIRIWANLYVTHGEPSLNHNVRKWSYKDKTNCIARIINGESYGSISKSLMMTTSSTVSNWHKRYLESGLEGLKYDGRGRPRKMNRKLSKKKVNKSLAAEIVELKRQLEYAEAENAYLKKLAALVQKRKAQEQKKK